MCKSKKAPIYGRCSQKAPECMIMLNFLKSFALKNWYYQENKTMKARSNVSAKKF